MNTLGSGDEVAPISGMIQESVGNNGSQQNEITIGTEGKTTLTVIDRNSREVIATHALAHHTAALALLRSIGDGFDAQITTPKYTELILSL